MPVLAEVLLPLDGDVVTAGVLVAVEPATLVAVLLPTTVLSAAVPVPGLLLLAVVLAAAVVRPVELLTLEPPLSEVLLANTLFEPVWYLCPLK